MPENSEHTVAKYALLVSIYEKIAPVMTVQDIFEIILSELVKAIHGHYAVIQVITSEKRKRYYGYHVEEGSSFWEPNEYQQCPEYIQTSINAVAQEVTGENKSSLILFSNSVYSQLLNNEQPIGYVIVTYNPENSRPVQGELNDYIQAVVNQIIIILNQKRDLNETVHTEKLLLIDKILTTLIHDMKNPLSGVSGFVQLIEQKSDDESIKKYCTTILNSLSNLAKINNDLHTVVSDRPLELKIEQIEIPVLIEEFINELSETYSHAGIEITIDSEADAAVQADKEKLKQVFRHVMKNAKEAMPEGGTIRIKAFTVNDTVTIEFGDTGCGMPVDIQEQVFKPFVSFGKEYATGLGMTKAQKIIGEHKGTLTVASFLGIGTVFTINLPNTETEKEATQ